MKKINAIGGNKVFDCITFFNENFITNLRFEILDPVVDFFVICESIYDHKGNKKKINFKLKNSKFKKKIIHIIVKDKFSKSTNPWKNQALQREKIFDGLKNSKENDFIMFSDPDEIPNPNLLKNFFLKKKYGIFMQKHFVYKINLLNQYENPWEGTRIVRKKNLSSIDYMRQKVLSKNLQYSFWRIDKERNIETFNNGGWHFNNLMSPKNISLKIRAFAHSEYNKKCFFDPIIIKKKIKERKDLFNRGRTYKKILINKNNYPKFIFNSLNKFRNFIEK
jgi:beta-1,4-mannosyl-glycoprotein beta-1,4-N-acetylglucosaminyltransferase